MSVQPTLKQLEALYWTGQLGSLQAAAKQLHTSQSAVGKRLTELQAIFGQRLLDPSHRRAKLTEHGQRLMACAEEVLLARQKLLNAMGEPSGFRGVLRLGVSELVAVTWLPLLIYKLKDLFPQTVIDLDVAPSGLILAKLKAGELQLVFAAGPMGNSGLDSVELAEVEYRWMASPTLRVPNRVLMPSELSTYPMLVHSTDSLLSQQFAQWQRKSGISVQRIFTSNSLMVTIEMTIGGLGISRLPAAYVANHVQAGKLVAIRTSPALPRATYYAAYRSVEDFPFISAIVPIAESVCDFTHSGMLARVKS